MEESYQKHLKKYYRTKQEWEEHMIDKSVLQFTPGVSQSQKEKANIKYNLHDTDCQSKWHRTSSITKSTNNQ